MYIFPYSQSYAKSNGIKINCYNSLFLYLLFMIIPLASFFIIQYSVISLIVMIISEIIIAGIAFDSLKKENSRNKKLKNSVFVFNPQNSTFYHIVFFDIVTFGVSDMDHLTDILRHADENQLLLEKMGTEISEEIEKYESSNDEKYFTPNVEITKLDNLTINKNTEKSYMCSYTKRDGSSSEVEIPKIYQALNLEKYI